MPGKPPLLCILGPTASGKTALAEAVVDALPGELVSVDSTLVYRGLDIGAASIAEFSEALGQCRTVVWNGPMVRSTAKRTHARTRSP